MTEEINISSQGKKYRILPSGYKQYLCSEEGCTATKQGKGGKCTKHGGSSRKKCIYEGCQTGARAPSEFCIRHGAKQKTCKFENCTKPGYYKGGMCKIHAPENRICQKEGCPTIVRTKSDFCIEHWKNRKTCKIDGCTLKANSGGRVCKKHSPNDHTCKEEGCERYARHKSDFCVKHGEAQKKCVIEDCNRVAQYKGGTCQRHSPDAKVCKHKGCKTFPQPKYDGYCHRHNPPVCTYEGCKLAPRRDGLCQNHISPEFRKEFTRKHTEYGNNRRKTDIRFRVYDNYRSRVRNAVKAKSSSTKTLIGCTIEEYMEYLEERFEDGMTWDNYGDLETGWHIDHIKPCCKFDLLDPEEQRACFHFSNTQPLWARENLSKGGRYVERSKSKKKKEKK